MTPDPASGTAFPDGFLWGAATAAHQVEGGNVNSDMWELEWATPSIFAEPSGDACDHYHRYRRGHRDSWPTSASTRTASASSGRASSPRRATSPARSSTTTAACRATCLEHGITPVVTYNHFSFPRWFSRDGGFEGAEAADRFARYSTKVDRAPRRSRAVGRARSTSRTSSRMLMVTASRLGRRPRDDTDGARSAPVRRSAVPHGRRRASTRWPLPTGRRSTRSSRSATTSRSAGRLALVDLQAAPGGEERLAEHARGGAARLARRLARRRLRRRADLLAEFVGPDGMLPPPEGAPTAQTGWEVYPEALGHTVRLAAERPACRSSSPRTASPPTDDDARREYTARCARAVSLVRSPTGSTSAGTCTGRCSTTSSGCRASRSPSASSPSTPTTFERTVKPSARWLGEIARAEPRGLNAGQRTPRSSSLTN